MTQGSSSMDRTRRHSRFAARKSLRQLHGLVAESIPQEVSQRFAPTTESPALAGLCLIAFLHYRGRELCGSDLSKPRNWLLKSAEPAIGELLDWVFAFIQRCDVAEHLDELQPWIDSSPLDVAERIYTMFDPRARGKLGFYCTPQALADFMVGRVHQTLVRHFGATNGLLARHWIDEAGNERPLNFLDPAVGTGVFLESVLKVARRHFRGEDGRGGLGRDWSNWLADNFLPRLYACDVQLGALACAHVRLAAVLSKSGFAFSKPVKLKLWRLNPLGTIADEAESENSHRSSNAAKLGDEFRQTPFTVIVGNPPYGANHGGPDQSMRDLMHGRHGPPGGEIDYFQSVGGPIGERKTWLYDLYVQFLRFSHWRIAQAGGGVCALLTNRGFMGHVTMRGLRYQWLRSFDRIEIHDFQGGDDRTPSEHARQDENVFGIRSGVAASIVAMGRSAMKGLTPVRLYTHAGDGAAKLDALHGGNRKDRRKLLRPAAPYFDFQPKRRTRRRTTSEVIPLDECFVKKSSAVVTARDGLVVAPSRSELLERIAALRDPLVGDEEIRRRFLGRSRGQKYLRGDTRGWKLAAARELLAADDDWQDHVRTCSYRPLDDRAIYWHRKMIDWPRDEVSQLMLEGNNPAIVARRQLPAGTNDGFFWITRWPTIDGIVRSDNRGNEFVFPIFSDAACTRTNVSERFLCQVSSALGIDAVNYQLDLAAFGHGPGVALFGYVAGLLFSPAYRQRHRAEMQSTFIPVRLPRDEETFRSIAQRGLSLVRELTSPLDSQHDLHLVSLDLPVKIRPPEFDGGCIRMGEAILLIDVDAADWEFRVGQHQVCRKWLADRKGFALTARLHAQYVKVYRTVERIRALVDAMESTIAQCGGIEKAFR